MSGTGSPPFRPRGWVLAALSSVIAYAALAGYDHIALLHIGKRVSWLFVTLCSFTTYALSHNIGGSVFSGAVIRYRAYGTRGLTGQDVGVLVAICWITFVLSTAFWPAASCWCSSREIIDRFSGVAASRPGDGRRPRHADSRRRLRLRQLAASAAR